MPLPPDWGDRTSEMPRYGTAYHGTENMQKILQFVRNVLIDLMGRMQLIWETSFDV